MKYVVLHRELVEHAHTVGASVNWNLTESRTTGELIMSDFDNAKEAAEFAIKNNGVVLRAIEAEAILKGEK